MQTSPRLSFCSHAAVLSCVLVLAIGACGGDDDASNPGGADAGDTSGAGAGSRASSGPRGEAAALCIEACDHQIGAGCPGTTEIWRPFCERICENTAAAALPDCLDELVALEQCRASLTWACDQFGGAQPTTACTREAGACYQCMGEMVCETSI